MKAFFKTLKIANSHGEPKITPMTYVINGGFRDVTTPQGKTYNVHKSEVETLYDSDDLQTFKICELAAQIKVHWGTIHPWAVPYHQAMYSMSTVDDSYGLDSGRDIVARFLSNARSWKGNAAKLYKAELNRRLK